MPSKTESFGATRSACQVASRVKPTIAYTIMPPSVDFPTHLAQSSVKKDSVICTTDWLACRIGSLAQPNIAIDLLLGEKGRASRPPSLDISLQLNRPSGNRP